MTRISEAQTRKRFIDQRLKAAGWPLTSPTNPQSHDPAALREDPTANGPADYALLLDGQIVAVIEAKKLTLGPQNVLTQAQRYTNGLPQPAPFLYSTNGEVIWHHDIRHKLNRSRQIAPPDAAHHPLMVRPVLDQPKQAGNDPPPPTPAPHEVRGKPTPHPHRISHKISITAPNDALRIPAEVDSLHPPRTRRLTGALHRPLPHARRSHPC